MSNSVEKTTLANDNKQSNELTDSALENVSGGYGDYEIKCPHCGSTNCFGSPERGYSRNDCFKTF